ncbi:MAG: transcriptional initiation protein Tat, partial [Alphaproteobacteria bacterium]
MNVFKKTLPRRTVLRGLGASIALPLLDSMVPALATASAPTVLSPKRLCVVYVPNGMAMKSWTPTT